MVGIILLLIGMKMVTSSNMTLGQCYKLVLIEKECVKHRVACNHDCQSCPYFADIDQLEDALDQSLNLIKAKEPSLYFLDNLQILKEVLSNHGSKN